MRIQSDLVEGSTAVLQREGQMGRGRLERDGVPRDIQGPAPHKGVVAEPVPEVVRRGMHTHAAREDEVEERKHRGVRLASQPGLDRTTAPDWRTLAIGWGWAGPTRPAYIYPVSLRSISPAFEMYPPTPPYSPNALPADDHPLVLQLNSLIDSYQRRRMWVCQFRADLESAGPSELAQTPSPASSEDSLHFPDDAKSSNSRWTRRKRGFKLRLDGLPSKPKRITLTHDQPGDSQSPPSREDILSMYEKMMESRMESCQRINRLIHSANRASLHNR